MTRQEHLDWAKRRALEYLDAGQPDQAIASMMSDLRKHESWATHDGFLATMFMVGMLDVNDPARLRTWILGFN